MENLKYILLKSVTIIDPKSKHHQKKQDILIHDGIIQKISKNIHCNKPFFEIAIKNLHVSPGWLDLHVRLGEPGFEQQETINSGLDTAANSGFTAVLTMPSTYPPIQNKSDIQFLLKKAENHIVDLLPTGCITKNCEQKEITEMFDMHQNGSIAFTDDKKSIQNAMLMHTALEYVKNFDGLIMASCLDKNLNQNGQINEGKMSVQMGLNPLPEIAETILVMRDLSLLKETDSKLHISTISTKESVKLIKKAKKKKLKISTDIAAHQLILSEDLLDKFDTNLKVMPPLRDEKTRLALIEGIIDGTIDVISSDHTPIEIEQKKCEFNKAKFGIIGLKTVFPIINTIFKDKLNLSQIIDLICTNPRKILNLETSIIQEGEKANMSLFDPIQEWTYTKECITSKSSNTPFTNYKFKGRALGIINNDKIVLNN